MISRWKRLKYADDLLVGFRWLTGFDSSPHSRAENHHHGCPGEVWGTEEVPERGARW